MGCRVYHHVFFFRGIDRDHIPSPRCSIEAARRDAQTSLLKELSDATHSSHKVLREIVVRVAGTATAYESNVYVEWIS